MNVLTTQYWFRIDRYFLLLVAFLFLTVAGCGTGPTKRYIDGDWTVSENVCSTNPNEPDKGDIRSEIRSRSNGTNAQRVVSIFYLDKTVLLLKNNATRSGVTGELALYENSAQNAVKRTQQARNLNEINGGIKNGITEFFENDPAVDGSKASSFCLYRGQ